MAAIWKVVGVVLLAASSFAAGAVTAGMRHWFQPIVHVSIENDSGQDLTRLVLSHSSSGNKSAVTLPPLKDGQSTEIAFFVPGEGGYQVEARFADGQFFKSSEAYVEGGASVKEVIRKPGH